MSITSVVRDPAVTPWPLTREQFDRLVELGEFEGQHVELLEGALVEMTPQGEEHSDLITLLNTELAVRLHATHGPRYLVRPQVPLAASPLSEPEPDLAIVERGARRRGSGHPSSALLVIEVAFSSQRIDLVHKSRIYAAAAVPEYWVVDLVRRDIVVHRGPVGPQRPSPDVPVTQLEAQAGYTSVERVGFSTPLDVLGISIRLAELIEETADEA